MSFRADVKEEMSIAGSVFLWGAVAIVLFAILGFLANALGFVSFSFWAPKVEQVRYDTFKQSQAYNEGMVRDLENLKIEYMNGNADQKASMRGIILHRFAVYDTNKLPEDLKTFYSSIQAEK